MKNYCIIPDESKVFLSFVTALPIAPEHIELLKLSQVLKVQVDAAAGTWEIFLETPASPVPANVLEMVANHLCEHCDLKQVLFRQTVAKPQQKLEVYLAEQWPAFAALVAGDQQGLKHLLLNAASHFDGKTLTVETIGEAGAEMLQDRGMEKQIQNTLLQVFDRSCQVRICAGAAAASDPGDICTPEYLEALAESAVANKAASTGKAADTPIIFGRNIKDNPQPIQMVQEEARNVVVEGLLVNHDMRELRSGRFLLTFDIADASDGISGKVFFENREQFDKAAGLLKSGMTVKAKGTVQFDKFSGELTLFADSMCRGAGKVERRDETEISRVELHAHTRMSALDAVVSVKNLIKTAARWGHQALAITDHGVVQSFPEADEVAAECGLKVIYGMEGYLFDDQINRARHIVILAKNSVGLRNLYRLVSISHLKYLHRTPRIPRTVLNEHREGLILGSACEAGELIQAMLEGASEEELLRIAAFYDYLEIQPAANNFFLIRLGKVPNEEALRDINRRVCELGAKLNKLVVATCDVHFLNPEDEVYRRILMAGQGYDDADNQPPLYFRTTEEMLAEFAYLGKEKAYEVVVTNTRAISDQVDRFKPIPDELYSPQIPGAEDAIRDMTCERAESMYGSPLPAVVEERVQYELNSIINNGFAVLYLIAHKLVKKSLDDGYLVGSRGSVGSSFVATMTHITEVNPLPPHWRCGQCLYSEFVTDGSVGGGFDLPDKDCPRCGQRLIKDGHDIPFAVFMGFHGDKVPDIDLNFSGDYQPVAHKYTEELFGKDNVFRAGTIGTIAEKTAYGFVKNYCSDKGVVARNAHVNRLVSGCTGVKRTTGQHPGGIMVVPRDMDVHHFTPIQYPADDKNSSTITTHFDYHSISSRLVKLDILGHDDPTVIKMLEDLIGIDPRSIPFDDEKTMSLFSSTQALGLKPEDLNSPVATFGIPEFGTKFVRQMLEDTKPTTFSELVRISGFSHGTDVWLNNAQDLIKNGTAKLSEAISTRDDIMVYLMHRGVESQLAFKVMEGVRKGKGIKADDVAKLRGNQVPDWYIESCQKIKYMFPKAHAVAYVMMAFRIAYCKVWHPLAFYAAYFTVRATEFDADIIVQGEGLIRQKMAELEQKGNTATAKEKGLLTILEVAREMYLRGFSFQRVNLYESEATRFLIREKTLLPPLASLQGLGDNAAQNIVAVRDAREFSSLEDLRQRCRISKTVVEILKNHGCAGDLPETDQVTLFG